MLISAAPALRRRGFFFGDSRRKLVGTHTRALAPRATMSDLPPLPAEPRPGLYRHYKGNDYRVLGLARHSETLEPLVIYQALYGERGFWVRPAAMFVETIEHSGRRQPRFALVRAD